LDLLTVTSASRSDPVHEGNRRDGIRVRKTTSIVDELVEQRTVRIYCLTSEMRSRCQAPGPNFAESLSAVRKLPAAS